MHTVEEFEQRFPRPSYTVGTYGGTYSITRGDETRRSYARRLVKWCLRAMAWGYSPPPRRIRASEGESVFDPERIVARICALEVRVWAVERERELREEMMVRHTIEGRYP